MSEEQAYEAGYMDGLTHYELEHCPACKNVTDLVVTLDENTKLRELCGAMLRFILPSSKRHSLKESMAIVDDFADRCKVLGIEVE